MASLPNIITKDKDLQLLQNKWISQLNPILANPDNNSSILANIPLTTGANVINHLLGRKLQGWSIVRQRAAASIYDTQDTNQTPALTLSLVSSADVVVDVRVF